MANKEIWLPVVGYEELYKVSSLGRVYSNYYNKIMRPTKCSGYLAVILRKDKIPKLKQVHRLVAEAFVENPEVKSEVNHKDGNKTNNHVDNLEWATRSENQRHAIKTGLRRVGGQLPFSKSVDCFDMDGNFVKTYSCIQSVEKDGYNNAHVVQCCKGKLKQHKGRLWKYHE